MEDDSCLNVAYTNCCMLYCRQQSFAGLRSAEICEKLKETLKLCL